MLAAPDDGGHRVGRYELIRRLAVGGMAEIYLARIPGVGIEGFEKLVVLKRILPQHAFDPELLRMFLDEARLSATLTHPHVTEVYDVGTTHDAPFFTMEYVHGANLRQLMKACGGRLPLEHAVEIVAAAAAGLHYAHEKLGPGGEPLGIVHRDVSPSNVLVSYDGAVKVSDFGIAKWAFQRTQTQDGALKGKFAYMSPEQCKGHPLDRRSDVFALGTILYELTTGAPPFMAEADFEIMNRIVAGAPEPPAWPAGEAPYPAALASVVMRALARDPDDRYPTAQALQVDLEAFARAERLEASTVALAGYMQTLFADELGAWREAQRAGRSLAQHLAQVTPQPTRRLSSPTVRTATDVFATTRRVGSLPRGRAVAGLIVALVLAAGIGGGVIAARKGSRRGPGAAGAEAAPSANAAPPIPTVTPAATAAGSGSTGAESGNIVGSHPAVPTRSTLGSQVRRAARGRGPATGVPARAADGPNLESRLKAWDPDSPVPP